MTEEQKIIRALIRVGTGYTRHRYEGRCPDSVEGFATRDPKCAACRAIMRAEQYLSGPPSGDAEIQPGASASRTDTPVNER